MSQIIIDTVIRKFRITVEGKNNNELNHLKLNTHV